MPVSLNQGNTPSALAFVSGQSVAGALKGLGKVYRSVLGVQGVYMRWSNESEGGIFSEIAAKQTAGIAEEAYRTGGQSLPSVAGWPKEHSAWAEAKSILYPGSHQYKMRGHLIANIKGMRARTGKKRAWTVGVPRNIKKVPKYGFGGKVSSGTIAVAEYFAWLEFGRDNQVPRPVVQMAILHYAQKHFPKMLKNIRASIERSIPAKASKEFMMRGRFGSELTMAECRKMYNDIFGVSIGGISRVRHDLEKEKQKLIADLTKTIMSTNQSDKAKMEQLNRIPELIRDADKYLQAMAKEGSI